jgi:hypothetical protein
LAWLFDSHHIGIPRICAKNLLAVSLQNNS